MRVFKLTLAVTLLLMSTTLGSVYIFLAVISRAAK